jgi:SOS-response transcriptional repressor LexA
MEKTARATKKQQLLLEYVAGFIREHGYGPSYREIMNAIGYKSVSTVAIHVNGLIAKGFLARKDNSPRSLEVLTVSGTHTTSATVSTPQTVSQALIKAYNACTDDPDKQVLLRALELVGEAETANKLRKSSDG